MKDIYDIIDEFKKRPAQRLALATVVRVEGSSYRRPGARMLICEDGTRAGSLSAGCLEDEVALRANEVFQTGEPTIVSFDTRRRFGCAGKIDIFIEPVFENFLRDLAHNLAARRICFVITGFGEKSAGSRVVRTETPDRSYAQEHEHELLQQIHPPIRLLIVGDGPDNRPLRSLGNLLGWGVVELVDPNLLSIEPDDWTAANNRTRRNRKASGFGTARGCDQPVGGAVPELSSVQFIVSADGRAEHRDFSTGRTAAPIQESAAADVRRLYSIGFLQSEPPYVGCYNSAFLKSTLGKRHDWDLLLVLGRG